MPRAVGGERTHSSRVSATLVAEHAGLARKNSLKPDQNRSQLRTFGQLPEGDEIN
jgi:hypothetical protein